MSTRQSKSKIKTFKPKILISKTKQELQKDFDELLKTYLADKTTDLQLGSKEFEVRFGTRNKQYISRTDFDNVLQKCKSQGFKQSPFVSTLKVQNEYTDPRSGNIKISRVRCEINTLPHIQEYCRTNQLPMKDDSPIDSIVFQQKQLRKIGETPLYPVNFDDFNFRVSYQIENVIQNSSSLVKSIVSKWNDSRKIFRYVTRTSFTHKDFPVRIDCSIVKSSKREGKSVIPTFTISESELFTQNEVYEIEIELLNTNISSDSSQTFETVMPKLRKSIMMVLSGIQQTNYPISYLEYSAIQDKYMEMIHGDKWESNPKKNIYPSHFIGPSTLTLDIPHITEEIESKDIPNIRENYTVTEKADGLRKMLYISDDGRIYLIDMNMNIQFTGTVTEKTQIFNTLIDGEHILHDKYGRYINLYAAFDLYFVQNKDVRKKEFTPTDSSDVETQYRLPLLRTVVKSLKLKSVIKGSKPSMDVTVKTFYLGDNSSEENSIFNHCNTILTRVKEGLFQYETDGLVFTPAHLGVGQRTKKDPIKDSKSTWSESLKWKPADQNTIDFLVSTKKNPSGNDHISNVFQDGISGDKTEQILHYKTLHLRVGFDERKHGYLNPCADVINDEINQEESDSRENYKPVPFYPTNPYDTNAHICNISLENDDKGVKQMFIEDKSETFNDNMIVEFRYDTEKEVGWRWIPIKVRFDKTEEYRRGLKNYGNAYHVANNNWKTIHNPITVEMITTGTGIPDEISDDTVYYNRSGEETMTRSLRDFHNLYVKRKLILSVSNPDQTLIDLAVGKAGDMPKWIAAKLSFVFGVDVSKDNIENRMDGACARYLNYRKKYKRMPYALFVNGNSSLNIRNGSGLFTEKGKEIVNAVVGVGAKDEEKLGKGVYRQFGKAEKGFDIVSCQFAIHYFFENLSSLKNFLINVTQNLQVGGHFIGTSYDGKKIFAALQDKEKGESIFKTKDHKKIWEIKKQYNDEDFLDNSTSVGYAIDVYQESINKTFREYLVNYDYLVRIAENFGLVPLSKEESNRLQLPSGMGNFNDLYKNMEDELKKRPYFKKEIKTANKMSESEKSISFLNKYFVFKKVRNVDVDSISLEGEEKIVVRSEALDPVDSSVVLDASELPPPSADEVEETEDQEKPTETKKTTKKKGKKLLIIKSKKKDATKDKVEAEDDSSEELLTEKKVPRSSPEMYPDEYDIPKGKKISDFWSRSKSGDNFGTGYDDWKKRLSNFHEDDIIIDGATWPTIEHWFQANKFMYKYSVESEPRYKEYVDNFKKGGKFDKEVKEGKGKAATARTAGSKTASQKAKVVIDPEWDTKSFDVMIKGIGEKIKQYDYMKDILKKLKSEDVYIVHYENTRGKGISKWGGVVKKKEDGTFKVVGQNLLGNIYMNYY